MVVVSLGAATAAITSGCQKNESENVSAQRLIEQTESDLQALKKDGLCESSVTEEKVGAELKTYRVSISCKNPDSIKGLKTLSERLSTTRSYLESRRQTAAPTPSQNNLIDHYMEALATAAQGVNGEIDQVNSATQDPTYIAAIQSLIAVGCQYDERKDWQGTGIIPIVKCQEVKTVEEGRQQIDEIYKMESVLSTRVHKLRLGRIVDLKYAENDILQRIRELSKAEAIQLPGVVAEIQKRYGVSVKVSQYGKVQKDLIEFSERSYSVEKLSVLVQFLKALLAAKPDDSRLNSSGIETIAWEESTLGCEKSNPKTLVLCGLGEDITKYNAALDSFLAARKP